MKNKFKQIQLKNLDKNLKNIRVCDRPSDGWIRTIRTALGMSSRQLAKRLGISQQALSRLEKSEIDGVITIKSLRKVLEVMGCVLEYVAIPNKGSLKETLNKQALIKADEIVNSVNHTMKLENQEVENKQNKIKEIAADLISNLNNNFWE